MSRFMRYNGTIIRPGSGSRLPPMPTMRDILKIQKLRALKELSQNFLMDEQLTARIVRQCGKINNYNVLEVGPAVGNITRSILRSGPKRLAVVEKDRRFIPTLDALAASVKPAIDMAVYRDDILNFNIAHAFPDAERRKWDDDMPPMYIIGNLPFAISTRLLINWLKDISLQRGAWSFGRTGMVLTFQKEVGQRIIEPILGEQRCRLSVMSQLWTKPIVRFNISGRAFTPKPNVDVSVVRFTPLREPLTTLPFDLVEKVMRVLFSMRQKAIKRPLRDFFPTELKRELTGRLIAMAQVSAEAKCTQLSNEECIRIAQAYSDILAEYPLIANYDFRAPRQQHHNVTKLTQNDIIDYDNYGDCTGITMDSLADDK